MSSVIVEPKATPDPKPVFFGRARWAAAVVLIAGSLLQFGQFILEAPKDEPAERIDYWMEHSARVEWSMSLGLVAIALLIGTFAALIALTKDRSPRLAWTGGVLLIVAMVGLAAVHGLELVAYWLASTGDTTTAVSALEATDLGLAGAVLFVMFLGGASLGTLIMSVAMWRSPVLPRAAAVFMVGFLVVDMIAGQPVIGHALSLASGTVAAFAVMTGYVRRPRHRSAK